MLFNNSHVDLSEYLFIFAGNHTDKMNYRFCAHLISVMIATLFLSCGSKNETPSLNESEIFFNEQLSSITVNGETCYIGTEDGVIYRYNPRYNSIDTLLSDRQFDRIYRVTEDPYRGDSTIWVGARNMGLYRCLQKGDSLAVKAVYRIEPNNLEYSPYDIFIEKESIYVGTSNGFYRMPYDTCSTLQRIYPKDGYKDWEPAQPFVVNSIQRYDNRYLTASSDGGILRVDIQNGEVKAIGTDEKVRSIVLKGQDIYALTEKNLKVYDIEGNLKKEYRIECDADLFYYVPETKVNYFINKSHVYLVQDENLENPDEYKKIRLRRNVRPECRNIIADIPHIDRSILVTENAIFGIAHNLNLFNNTGEARTAVADDGYIYYLMDNRVFRIDVKDTGSKDINAKHMVNIPEKYDIKYMIVVDGQIYFVDNGNTLYTIDTRLGNNYYMNSLSAAFSIKELGKIDEDVTAFGGGGLLCGIRDSIISLDSNRKGEKILMHKSGKDNVNAGRPFITKFSTNDKDIWVGTLNHGIFKGDGSNFYTVDGSQRFRYIRDMAFAGNNAKPYVLTNHHVYTPDWKDSIRADGFYRLLATKDGHIYGIGNFGIREFIFSGTGNSYKDYYTDIKFNPDAVIADGNTIFAGSTCGVFMFDQPLGNGASHSSITFQTAAIENFWEYAMYTLGLIILFAMAVLATRRIEKRRYSIERLNRKKGEVLERLYYLESLSPFLNRILVEKIGKDIAKAEGITVSNNRKSQRMIKALQRRSEVTREQAEKDIRGLLEEQKKCLKKAGKGEAETLLKESGRNMSFAEAATQTKRNHKWIEQYNESEKTIRKIEEFCSSAVVVEGITDGIDSETRKYKELTDENEKKELLERLIKRMQEIGSGKNCSIMAEFIDSEIARMRDSDIVNEDIIIGFRNIGQLLEKVNGDNEKMKELLIETRLISSRAQMHTCILNIGKLVRLFYTNIEKTNSCRNEIESIQEYEVSRLKAMREKLETRKKEADTVIKDLNREIEKFYAPAIENGTDIELFSLVGLSASNCRNYSNNARIMALLLCGEKVENSHIHILIGISYRGENMRKERGIVEQNMKKNLESVLQYRDKHPTSFAGFIINYLNR